MLLLSQYQKKMARRVTVIGSAGLLLLMLVSALPIAELVIGSKYIDTDGCSNATVILPTTWLIVSGGVSLVFIAVTFLSFSALLMGSLNDEIIVFGPVVLQTLFSGFFFAWSIVGAVMLWRDNVNCNPLQLHDMLWASVIIRLVSSILPILNARLA